MQTETAAVPTSAVTPPSLYQVELDVFEGPLDLLLHLVRKHELDILDIPIAFVTEKYLEYLDLMRGLHINLAGEYLLMAATLAYIKSQELLPRENVEAEEADVEGEEEVLDPRQELIRRLLEYQKYKNAANQLGVRPVVGRNVWTRGAPQVEALAENVDQDMLAPLAEFPVIKLIEALDRALTQAQIKLAHTVQVDRLSVSERINQLADRLEREQSFGFLSCFSFLQGEGTSVANIRHEAVVTLLALLEMAKLGLIRLSQPDPEDSSIDDDEPDIYISTAIDNLRERMTETLVKDDYL